MQTFPLEEPPSTRKPTGAGIKVFVRILVSAIFVLSCLGAGKLAIKMASKDLPEAVLTTVEAPARQIVVTLRGSHDDPLFMGSDRESLRAFFANYSTLESRTKASLQSTGIRKIQELLEVQTMRTEADAIQVRVASGAIAGAVYWVHHSQMNENPAFDSIIAPIPAAPGASGLGTDLQETDILESAVPRSGRSQPESLAE